MRAGAHGDPYAKPFYARLRRGVELAVQYRWRVLAATALLFVCAAAGMGLVQQQFFPIASRPELLVELRLKNGASFAATTQQVEKLEQVLARDPDVRGYTAYTGGSSPRFYMSLAPELPDPGFAQFVVDTSGGVQGREAVRGRLMALFEAGRAFPELRARVSRLEFGPPVGFPVQFRVIGPDPDKVRAIASQVRDIVRGSPLVRDTQLDWDEKVRTLGVQVDQAAAARLGLSDADVQRALQTALSGATVTQVVRGNDVVDVVLRADRGERHGIADLGDLLLFSPSAGAVPLSAVARIEPRFEDPVLWRWNRRIAITVRSEVADGVQAPDATTRIWPALQPVLQALPAGYSIEQGGAIEESAKANKALYAVFPLMFATMLLFLMLQLQSFSRMAMVFMTAPLGLIGVVPALLVRGAPFGFVALLGVIALGGMIMRNAVILVDQIDRDIAEGKAPWQAVVDATVRRTRPVLLTAAAAILAMVPLAGSEFWGPMAVSIMGGLVVATALTLGFVPALYAAWFGIRRDTPARAPRD
jgi:multidrug efflux pump subunit AcrB